MSQSGGSVTDKIRQKFLDNLFLAQYIGLVTCPSREASSGQSTDFVGG